MEKNKFNLGEYKWMQDNVGIKCDFYFDRNPINKSAPIDSLIHVVVRFSSLIDWNVNIDDLIKILYWYACKEIRKAPSRSEYTKELLRCDAPLKCPIDPKSIKFHDTEPFIV